MIKKTQTKTKNKVTPTLIQLATPHSPQASSEKIFLLRPYYSIPDVMIVAIAGHPAFCSQSSYSWSNPS
jgi:hypothetical protein